MILYFHAFLKIMRSSTLHTGCISVYDGLMKNLLLAGLLLTANLLAADKFGKPLEGRPVVTLEQLLAKPETFVGKPFQVAGRVTEVCQAMGCWVMLTDADGRLLRFQSEKHDLGFPMKASVGRQARVEGTLARYELTKEEALAEAKHRAEDAGKKFDPLTVKGPQVVYQIEGNAAELD
jgi:hypothetical protein